MTVVFDRKALYKHEHTLYDKNHLDFIYIPIV